MNLKNLFTLLFTFFILTAISFSQESVKTFDDDGSYYVKSSVAVAGADTVYSTSFSAPEYDGVDFTTYPINYTKTLTSTSDKPHITTTIQGSFDDVTYYTLDSLGAVGDSAETNQTGTLDLNSTGFKNHYRYYRFEYIGLATNPADATAVTWLNFARKENE
jgi:hypothetical protein